MSGRRRQDKSYLLQALATALGGMYFLALELTEAVSLRLFADELIRFSVKRQKKAVLTDRQPAPATRRKELITRLQAGRCEWCEKRADVEVHQVRKLADLARTGRPQPAWAQLMATMRRKTLLVCLTCHQAIHAKQPTATLTG